MRLLLSLVALFTTVMMVSPASLAFAQAQVGPDGTPQVEAGTERLRYTQAAPPQLMTHYRIVFSELDQLPLEPDPAQVKSSQLRKRMLDLRLTMDLYAYAYQPGQFAVYRAALDEAYEAIGEYKDLFDVQAIDGLPIDETLRQTRLARMKVALTPFRTAGFRDDLQQLFQQPAHAPLALSEPQRPRLWQIAGLGPSDGLDSVGNVALLSRAVIQNVRAEGILIGDILNPTQEERFHDVRKALRSALLLADMYPSLTAELAEVREPLADLVKAYGKTNDEINAYRAALAANRDLAPRAEALRASHDKAQAIAREVLESGQLDAYIGRLGAALAAANR